MNRLKNKVAIVVGAGSITNEPSNGSAAAFTYAMHGAKVICADKDIGAARATAGAIAAEGYIADSIKADVTRAGDIQAMVRMCIDLYGRIDILHNNVGIEELGDLIELDEASWNRVIDVNLTGMMRTMKEAMPHMLTANGASIINISSIAGKKWSPMQFLSYSTSKAAIIHMTKVVARQYAAYHVRCNVIVPGLIASPHAYALFRSEKELTAGRVGRNERCPMGHQGTVWDIANAALFLASDESKYITGAELVVDGGLSL